MSDITLESIKSIVNKTLDQFQEAVFLLKSVHDGTAAQQEIASFLSSIGVMTEQERIDAAAHDDALLVGQAIAMLNADTPLPGVFERHWSSAARTFLAKTIANMPMDMFREIVSDDRKLFALVKRTIGEWSHWAHSASSTPRNFEKHLAHADLMEIVPALLRELKK